MIFYTVLITGIIVDWASKQLATIYLQDRITILGDFLYGKFALNPGIAFGIEVYPLLLKIITIVLIICIFYYYKSERKEIKNKTLLDISFGLILAGAIGNAIERVLYSQVIDFIGIKYFSIFNLADSFITIGALIYIYLSYKTPLSSSFIKLKNSTIQK